MAVTAHGPTRYAVAEIENVRYAMIPESLLLEICRRAGVSLSARSPGASDARPPDLAGAAFDHEALAARLIARRKQAELSQAELARRAGVRVETLNRIERGKTTPDFSTVRKLVNAINKAEAEAREGAFARLTLA